VSGVDTTFDLTITIDGGVLQSTQSFTHEHQEATPPTAPSNVTVIGTSSTSVDVTWTDNTTVEDEYIVEYSSLGGPFIEYQTLPPDSTATTITGLNPATDYTVRITASNSFGQASDTGSGFTGPFARINLTATPNLGAQLDWDTVSDVTVTAQQIERSTPDQSSWVDLIQVNNTATTYTDTTVTELTQYYYRIYALNAQGGRSSDSNVASIYTPVFKPAAPTGLVATADSTSQITVTWTDNATTEADYRCERSADGSTGWVNISGSLGASATQYIDTGLASDTTWYYRSICSNSFGDSDPSNVDSATTSETVPNAPTNLRLSAPVTSTSIPLAWDDNATNETSYTVERSDDNGSSWVTAESLPANSTSVSTTAPATYTTYQYRVFCSNASGPSNFSNILQVWSNHDTMLQNKQGIPLEDKVGDYLLDKTA
jgi:titin